MIARTWRGWTSTADADAYVGYLRETGFKEYRQTAGNRAAYLLRRQEGDRTEFVALTFWDSLYAVKAFAGDDVERAVFYPEDDRFLVERETVAHHYEVIDGSPGEEGADPGPTSL
jgi:heme-degrading monooxygenase HmoA